MTADTGRNPEDGNLPPGDTQEVGRRSRLVTGAAWMGSARIVNGIISFLSTVMLARLLSPDDFGLIAIAAAIAMLIMTMSDLSLSQALIHVEDLEDGHFDTAFTLGTVRGVLTFGLIALAAVPIAAFYGDDRLIDVMFIFGGVSIVSSLVSPRFVLYQRALDFRGLVALDMADKVVGLITAVSIAWSTGSYFALPFGVLASQVARLILTYLLSPYRPRFTLSHWRDLVSFSIWMTLGLWVHTLNWRLDAPILGYFVPTSALGQFSIAERVSGIVSRELLIPVGQMLFPAFSRIRNEPERLRSAYLAAQGVLTSAALPATIGLALVAEPLVRLLLSEKWLPAVPYIQLLAICSAVRLLQSIHPIAMATGETKALFKRDVSSLLIRIPMLIIGIFWGQSAGVGVIIGALSGRALAGVINSLLNMLLISRISTVTVWDHFRVMFRPLIAVLSMTACVILLKPHAHFGFSPPEVAMQLFSLAAAGAAVYFATLVATWILMRKPPGAETHALEILNSSLEKLKSIQR